MIIGTLLKVFHVITLPAGVLSLFVWITFLSHTIQDYFTSRLNSRLWAKGDTHNFFVSIGWDQVLHYTQLLLTYYYLKSI
jgi:hypothetical protein